MRTWFTGDTHFNHKKIVEYDERPFKSTEHMDREIIRRWNDRVKPEDTVVHLGDFGFLQGPRNFQYYRSQLNGNLVLIKGNHDGNNSMKSNIQNCVITLGGIDWWCQHEPVFQFPHNLCAHVHNLWKVSREGDRLCINVGQTQWDYRPILIEDILRAIADFKKSPFFLESHETNQTKRSIRKSPF